MERGITHTTRSARSGFSPVAARAAAIAKRDGCTDIVARVRAEHEITGERPLGGREYSPEKLARVITAKLAIPHRAAGRASPADVKRANRAVTRDSQLSMF
jgi:hypothetical protein